MSYKDDPLWQALAAMRIEPAGAATTFTAKLAREHRWAPDVAEQVMEEYRRFLYLARVADHPVSPSAVVDKAWHLHLTYSRHYWDVLCGQILHRPLHHEPSLGGGAEDARHRDQYQRTLQLYRQAFGEEPPAAIWPSPSAPRRQPRRAALRIGGAASAALLLAACTALGAAANAEGEDDNALLGFIIIGVFIAGVYFLVKRLRRGRGGGRGRRAGASSGGAYGGYDSHDRYDRDDDRFDNDSGSDGSSSCGSSCGGGGD
jgi:hypothetical protein